MISFLRGVVVEKTDSRAILDVSGVGYGLIASIDTLSTLSLGHEATLVVYEHIKEDAHDLYGFTDSISKVLFEKLLSVTGVGPKMAISIMNLGNPEQLAQAIRTGETKYIQNASGVGKRLAERIVVDLKDKLGLPSSDNATDFLSDASYGQDEAAQALVALGSSVSDAGQALSGIDPELSTEERVKLALGKSGR